MSPLSFDIGWTDRNADCCVNTVDEKKLLRLQIWINFGPATREILWLICMVGDCREANIRSVLVKCHSLGGSSIASMWISKKCTVEQCACRAGYTLGCDRFLSIYFVPETGAKYCY